MTIELNREPPPDEVTFKRAWRLNDAAMERDAELFWHAMHALPQTADVGRRLSDLCAVAYSGGGPVALTTAAIRVIPPLRCKLAMFRAFVAPDARNRQIATQVTLFTRDLLEGWAKENPDEQVLGLGTVVQSRVLVDKTPWAIWPDTRLAFIGYTQEGYQMRVYWFTHAKLSNYWPGDPGTVGSHDLP